MVCRRCLSTFIRELNFFLSFSTCFFKLWSSCQRPVLGVDANFYLWQSPELFSNSWCGVFEQFLFSDLCTATVLVAEETYPVSPYHLSGFLMTITGLIRELIYWISSHYGYQNLLFINGLRHSNLMEVQKMYRTRLVPPHFSHKHTGCSFSSYSFVLIKKVT